MTVRSYAFEGTFTPWAAGGDRSPCWKRSQKISKRNAPCGTPFVGLRDETFVSDSGLVASYEAGSPVSHVTPGHSVPCMPLCLTNTGNGKRIHVLVLPDSACMRFHY